MIMNITVSFYDGDADQEYKFSKPSPVEISFGEPNFDEYMDAIQSVVDKYEDSQDWTLDTTIDQGGSDTEQIFNFPTAISTSEVPLMTKIANQLLDDVIAALKQAV